MADPALALIRVEKYFGDRKILDQIDLTLEKGMFLAFVGANGQGKTTLMKSMLDFVQIDGGRIEIMGCSHRQTQAREPVAFLPERFNLPFFLTGQGFLQYMMNLHRRPYRPEAVLRMLENLDLNPTSLSQTVRTYSKGMMQKLGLASCFLSEKPLLVLDEPMSGLDPKARVLLKRQLLRMKSAGFTLFFSTHLLADVETLCDRMAILHDGQLRFVGSPEACRRRFGGQTLEESFIACIEGRPVSLS